MHPPTHVLSSCIAVLAYSYLAGMSTWQIVVSVVVGAAATVLIDADHLLAQLLMPERRHIILGVLRKPHAHMDSKRLVKMLHFPGFGAIRMAYHIVEVAVATALLWSFEIPYAAAIMVSLWVHVLADLTQYALHPGSR